MSIKEIDIKYYLDLVNSDLLNNGSKYKLVMRKGNGYYHLALGNYTDSGEKHIKCGLTKKELYNIVYCIAFTTNLLDKEVVK